MSDGLDDLLPAERPRSFDLLTGSERAWRRRIYLAVWAMGPPEAMSWDVAMHDGPALVVACRAFVKGVADEAIREAVAARSLAEAKAWFEGLRAEGRKQATASRVTILTSSGRSDLS